MGVSSYSLFNIKNKIKIFKVCTRVSIKTENKNKKIEQCQIFLAPFYLLEKGWTLLLSKFCNYLEP
jgi:hypothetical protein